MAKPTEFFDLGLPEQSTFLKDGLRKKTTAEHWALLEYSKVNGLFTQHDPERNKLAATYEAENLHMAFQNASDMGEWKKYLQVHPPSPEALAVLVLVAVGVANKARSKDAADKGHEKPTGSRDKKQKIRDIWASGKYKTKVLCAEEEYVALEVSFDKARRDLIGTPDPSPWPAKTCKKG